VSKNSHLQQPKTIGFNNIALDIEKHYGLTQGMQDHVDELTRKISYERG